jgi:hypothetical protein
MSGVTPETKKNARNGGFLWVLNIRQFVSKCLMLPCTMMGRYDGVPCFLTLERTGTISSGCDRIGCYSFINWNCVTTDPNRTQEFFARAIINWDTSTEGDDTVVLLADTIIRFQVIVSFAGSVGVSVTDSP